MMSGARGLTSIEAKNSLAHHGFNELPSSKRKSLWLVAFAIVREPMVALLLGGATIYFFIGAPQDSILLLLSVLVIVTITIYQEHRSTRALEVLRDLSSPRALVIRDGKEQRVAAREIVPGDLLMVKEGDRVAADCYVLEAINLEADESLLTGESRPVPKRTEATIFSSTLVTSGHGLALVFSTGLQTEVGKIGKSLEVEDDSKTRLQLEVGQLVRRFGTLGIVFSIIVILSYGFTRGNWPQGILAGIAAAMSLLPEEFPVILTIFLALGAWKLSKKHVLVRQTAATENLGGVTVLCVDKTGTLTQNQMSVQQLRTPSSTYHFQSGTKNSPSEEFQHLLEYAVLASQKDPFDPMEKALHRVNERLHSTWTLEKEYPLAPNLLAMSRVWKREDGSLIVATKGAPEIVLDLCHLENDMEGKIRHQVEDMSSEGYRVLGVAESRLAGSAFPASQQGFQFQFLGLLGFIDPLRPQAAEAVQDCRNAGIRVMMITGDHAGTACKIASDIGLTLPKNVLTGADLENMSEVELRRKVESVSVYARMVPAQKLRIVNALKANGEVVGMTGDGVNDAPSLKWADVGIAMGGRGTDVAREAADLVILDDDFKSIVAAIRLGRGIFDNIRRAMSFIFATHFPIAALAITPVLLGMPLIFFPSHVVFMELIIDPACTLIFEAKDEDPLTMKRPPRKLNQPLFGYKGIFYSSLQGVVVFVVVFLLFFVAVKMGLSDSRSRTLAFSTFVLSIVGLIVANESIRASVKNIFFWTVFGLTLVSLNAVMWIPALRRIFGLEVPSLNDLAIAVTAAVVAFALSVGTQKLEGRRAVAALRQKVT